MPAADEFIATIIFAGSLPGITQTRPLLVYNVLERDSNAAIWTALTLVTISIVATVVVPLLARLDTTTIEIDCRP